MTKDEALRLALEALYGFIPYLPLEHDKPQCDRYDQAITAIKAALEAKDERNNTLEEVAKEFDAMRIAFGDTAHSFAQYVRDMKLEE
jgi:hypothetical protein